MWALRQNPHIFSKCTEDGIRRSLHALTGSGFFKRIIEPEEPWNMISKGRRPEAGKGMGASIKGGHQHWHEPILEHCRKILEYDGWESPGKVGLLHSLSLDYVAADCAEVSHCAQRNLGKYPVRHESWWSGGSWTDNGSLLKL
jgi:hypothetical protein